MDMRLPSDPSHHSCNMKFLSGYQTKTWEHSELPAVADTEIAAAVDNWKGTAEMGEFEAMQLAVGTAAGIDRMTRLAVGILERFHIAEHSTVDRQQHCNLCFVDRMSAVYSLLPAVGMLW